MFATMLVSRARAGNDESILVGNDAAMSAGAVTPTVHDGTALWYNPAGLALVHRNSVDVSGTATQLRYGEAREYLRSSSGRTVGGDYLEFVGIPSAVTAARQLSPGVVASLGIFVPRLADHIDRVNLSEPLQSDPTRQARWQLIQHDAQQSYYLGLGMGFRLSDTVRFGFVAFGFYRNNSSTGQFFGGVVDNMNRATSISGFNSLNLLQSIGLDIGVGLQWDVSSAVTLGFSLRSPGLQIGTRLRSTRTRISADQGAVEFAPEDDGGITPSLDVVTPAKLRMGMAYDYGDGQLIFDFDLAHALDLPSRDLDRVWLFNARIGLVHHLEENLSLGAGMFTDLSPNRDPTTFGATRIDFYGATFGVEWRTPHRLAEGDTAENIVFGTTIAGRYAFGTGKIGGLLFDSENASNMPMVTPVRTSVHELSIHIGTCVLF